tara:strand:+ start:396 stop:653 length:258 start_codon:yes stop_codon:yes gene_type:complete
MPDYNDKGAGVDARHGKMNEKQKMASKSSSMMKKEAKMPMNTDYMDAPMGMNMNSMQHKKNMGSMKDMGMDMPDTNMDTMSKKEM